MNAAPAFLPCPSLAFPKTNNHQAENPSSPTYRGFPMQILSGKARRDARAADPLFIRMLWAAFPSPSENKLAERAAPVLGVTERQVKNWLQGNNDGKAAHFATLVLLVGVERLAQIIEGKQP